MYNMLVRIYFGLLAIVLFAIICGRCNEFGGPVTTMANSGYQAVVLIIINRDVVDICGGTILSEFHVLTTASCFAKSKHEFYDIQVRVGSIQFLDGGDVYNVSKVERHPEYNTYDSTHNLAIIFISKRIIFMAPAVAVSAGTSYTKNVHAAPLGSDFIIGGEAVRLTTYSKKALKTTENELQEMQTYTVNFFRCYDIFTNAYPNDKEIIHDEILCVLNADFDGNCDILEGSPVVHESKLVGVFVNIFDPCSSHKREPLLITRIANKYLWLNQHVNPDRFKNPFYNGPTCAPVEE